MNKRLKIYEAGKMSGLSYKEMNDWRESLKRLLNHYATYYSVNLTVVNPVDFYNFEEKAHKTEKEVFQFDMNHVKSSDIIIVNLKGLNTSIGTVIELYEAYKRDIPVLALGTEEDYNALHPWIKEFISRVDDTEDKLTFYIKEFYFTE